MRPLNRKVPLMLRLPERLRRNLAKAAKRNGNSMNGEIVDRLTQVEIEREMLTTIIEMIQGMTDGQQAPTQAGPAPQERPPQADADHA